VSRINSRASKTLSGQSASGLEFGMQIRSQVAE
jgi:hypothetical protein